jgi:hypothetical protein
MVDPMANFLNLVFLIYRVRESESGRTFRTASRHILENCYWTCTEKFGQIRTHGPDQRSTRIRIMVPGSRPCPPAGPWFHLHRNQFADRCRVSDTGRLFARYTLRAPVGARGTFFPHIYFRCRGWYRYGRTIRILYIWQYLGPVKVYSNTTTQL